MRIAINTRFSAYPYAEGYGNYVREIAGRLPGLFPEDRFLFLTDQQALGPSLGGSAVEHRVMGPAARHPLLWRFWYDVQVPRALRGMKADVFFSPDGICSLRTSTPQVLTIHDLAFLHFPASLPAQQQRYYRRQTPKFIRKAARIITVSEFSKQDIIAHYPESAHKIRVVPNAADPAFQPISGHEKESVKDRLTGGMEYFLYSGSIHPRKNLTNLLKAFSIFKKRQKTGMKLVLAGRLAWQSEEFAEAMARYKYREDVVMTGFIPVHELRQLVAAAYATIYPSLWEGFGMPLLEAMQSGVPVLCSNTSALPETAGDAALYFDPMDPQDISTQMTKIYIDEALRAVLIGKGLDRCRLFDWKISASMVREILTEAAGGKINA